MATSDNKDPATITTHTFVPKGEWWTTCGHVNQETGQTCNLGEAAHSHSQLVDNERKLAPRAEPQDPDAVH